MTIDFTDIITALLGLCATLITVYLVPWIKQNADTKTLENIKLWAGIAVQAAESLYDSGQGQKKKKYVLDYLAGKGIKVDDAQVEAAVYELINGYSKEMVFTQSLQTGEE